MLHASSITVCHAGQITQLIRRPCVVPVLQWQPPSLRQPSCGALRCWRCLGCRWGDLSCHSAMQNLCRTGVPGEGIVSFSVLRSLLCFMLDASAISIDALTASVPFCQQATHTQAHTCNPCSSHTHKQILTRRAGLLGVSQPHDIMTTP